jgi:hypothetical protein
MTVLQNSKVQQVEDMLSDAFHLSCSSICWHTLCVCYSLVLWLLSEHFHAHHTNYSVMVDIAYWSTCLHFIHPGHGCQVTSDSNQCHPVSFSSSVHISWILGYSFVIWSDNTTRIYHLKSLNDWRWEVIHGQFQFHISTLVVNPVRFVWVTGIEAIACGHIALTSSRITWLIDFYPKPFVFFYMYCLKIICTFEEQIISSKAKWTCGR